MTKEDKKERLEELLNNLNNETRNLDGEDIEALLISLEDVYENVKSFAEDLGYHMGSLGQLVVDLHKDFEESENEDD